MTNIKIYSDENDFVLFGWNTGGICNGEGRHCLARRKLQDAVSSIRRRQTSLFVDIQKKEVINESKMAFR